MLTKVSDNSDGNASPYPTSTNGEKHNAHTTKKRIISGIYTTVPRIAICVVCWAIMADDAPATKTQRTAKLALSISLSPFCSIKSYILYLELIVRVCSDSSASLIGRDERLRGILIEPHSRSLLLLLFDCSGGVEESAWSRTLFAADRVRHDSSVASVSKSICDCNSSTLPILLLLRLLLTVLLEIGTCLVIDVGAKPLATLFCKRQMQANEKTSIIWLQRAMVELRIMSFPL
jgi:hypothetical protein